MSQVNQSATEAVLEQLRHIITNRLDANLKLEEVKADVPISEDGLGLDSIMIVEFIALVEETFGFQFTDEELTSELFADLNTLAAFIVSRGFGGGGSCPESDGHDSGCVGQKLAADCTPTLGTRSEVIAPANMWVEGVAP